MELAYFKQSLDKIYSICELLDKNSQENYFDRPRKVSYREDWMADGFYITWEEPSHSFEVCCIWSGMEGYDPVVVIGATIRKRDYNIETEETTYTTLREVKIDFQDTDLIPILHEYEDLCKNAYENQEGGNNERNQR